MIWRYEMGSGVIWLLRPVPSTTGYGWELVRTERS